MLDRRHRLSSAAGFATAVRRGRRAARGTLVVHLHVAPGAAEVSPRVGLVVGRSVGNAVARNRVKRRLRHLLRPRLARLPASSVLVVRALPASASMSSARLGADLDAALERAGTRGRAESLR